MAKKKTTAKKDSGPSRAELQAQLDEANEEKDVMRAEMAKMEKQLGWYERKRKSGKVRM